MFVNDDLFNKVVEKQDKIGEDVTEIKVTLAQQAEVLKDHTRRSLANEEMVAIMREEFKPIKKRFDFAENAFKIIGFSFSAVSGIAGFGYACIKIYSFFLGSSG